MSTKAALLNTAEALIRRRGYDAFSFADLAEEVGIRKPSVHHHFPTKGQLATALIARYDEAMRGQLAQIDPASAKALKSFVQIYRDALGGGDTICLCAALSAGRDSLPEPARARLDQFFDHVLGWLSGVVGDDALFVLSLVEGAQLMARTRGDVSVFDTATAPALARYAHS